MQVSFIVNIIFSVYLFLPSSFHCNIWGLTPYFFHFILLVWWLYTCYYWFLSIHSFFLSFFLRFDININFFPIQLGWKSTELLLVQLYYLICTLCRFMIISSILQGMISLNDPYNNINHVANSIAVIMYQLRRH